MIIHSKIDKGVIRNSNQDAFIAGEISSNFTFGIVCDGMGGANAGNIASEIAVKTVSEYLYNSFRENMSLTEIERVIKNAIASIPRPRASGSKLPSFLTAPAIINRATDSIKIPDVAFIICDTPPISVPFWPLPLRYGFILSSSV